MQASMRFLLALLIVSLVQPGGELRDPAVGPSPGLLTMPSCLPFPDKSVPSIFVDGLLRASDFLVAGTDKLLTEQEGFFSFLRQ